MQELTEDLNNSLLEDLQYWKDKICDVFDHLRYYKEQYESAPFGDENLAQKGHIGLSALRYVLYLMYVRQQAKITRNKIKELQCHLK